MTLETLIGRVLSINPSTITDATGPHSVESWDSFNGLMLVAELEKHYAVKFTLDEIIAVKNVGYIKRALRSHGISI